MKKNIKIAMILITLFLAGCSSKDKMQEYNKPAIYWYSKMVKAISSQDLEKADEYFTSLESEHLSSPLVQESLLLMATAHMDNEEYLMAQYYLDEYLKRFGSGKKGEFAEFLKIKASFYGFKNINRDQKLLKKTIAKAQEFKNFHPNSVYLPLVDTILTKLYMAEYILNENIVTLYKRRGKIKAAEIYQKRLKNSWLKKEEIIKPTNWVDYFINW
jgi:outer membrane protein assembly factor BamD